MSAPRIPSHRSVSAILAACAVLCCTRALAATPSFVCSKATSWMEKTVCGSERLSDLDLELAVAYAHLLRAAGSSGDGDLRIGQQRWWAARDECRRQDEPAACLERRYTHRIAALKSRPDYSDARPVRQVELPPEPLSAAGEGWSRSLSRYVKAIRACLEKAPLPVHWVEGARDDSTYDDAVAVYLRGPAQQNWVCTARRDGMQVLAWHDLGGTPDGAPGGPRFYPYTTRPAQACGTPVKVLDESDVHVGWIGPACEVVESSSH